MMEWLQDAETPWVYISLNFAAILGMFSLGRISPSLLVVAVAAFTIAATLQFMVPLNQIDENEDDRLPGFIKFIAEMPLGLGSLALFGLLSKARQDRYIKLFTYYVNFAVVGNIAMMVFVPAGDTYRGLSSRMACVAMVVWLLQEIIAVGWLPVRYENGVFIFTASPVSWVIAHAFYRMVLISLPSFETGKYIVMEPASLTMMLVYHRFCGNPDYPVSYYFGASDTLVIATMSAVSMAIGGQQKLFTKPVSEWVMETEIASKLFGGMYNRERAAVVGDWVGVGVHVMVTLVALRAIAKGPVSYKRELAKLD